jgi:hypothetical protein
MSAPERVLVPRDLGEREVGRVPTRVPRGGDARLGRASDKRREQDGGDGEAAHDGGSPGETWEDARIVLVVAWSFEESEAKRLNWKSPNLKRYAANT